MGLPPVLIHVRRIFPHKPSILGFPYGFAMVWGTLFQRLKGTSSRSSPLMETSSSPRCPRPRPWKGPITLGLGHWAMSLTSGGFMKNREVKMAFSSIYLLSRTWWKNVLFPFKQQHMIRKWVFFRLKSQTCGLTATKHGKLKPQRVWIWSTNSWLAAPRHGQTFEAWNLIQERVRPSPTGSWSPNDASDCWSYTGWTQL